MKYNQVSVPVPYIPIGGTCSWDEDDNSCQWWERGSVFTASLAKQNLILHARTPFEWATNVDGLFYQRAHTIWKGAAKHLQCHLERVPLEERNLVAHSHGGQVVFFAAAAGVRINNLITVGTPVRADMQAYIDKARGNIGYWHHICDSSTDLTAVLGSLFDGKLRITHRFPQADSTSDVRGIGHSKILNDAAHILMWNWDQQGWSSYLAYGKDALRV